MLPVRRTSNSWLPEIFNDFFDNSWMERTNYTAPAINVIENEKEYELELAAPGLSKEDFKIQLDSEGNLVINMEKKTENKEKEGGKKGRFLRREFSYEKFHQSLVLPDDVDREKIEAKMENGVLNVHLPKIVKAPKAEEHRMIEVK
ncbi:MAG: Hsp20/alpha crystallin family protein [Bacteroidales bacterium]|nr:Hsp20/alpha crystallin family protein [Bacteroidales bacterium]